MIMKANKQIGFIYKDDESIDRILKDGDVVFERGFLREKTSTTLPITFDGVGKDLKDYKIYGNTVQNGTPTPDAPIDMVSCGDMTKNLIGFEDLPETTSNGVTYSIKDNVFTLNGTATDNIRYIYNNKYHLGNGGNYTLKIEVISGSWTAGAIGLSSRSSTNTQVRFTQLGYNISNLTTTKNYSNTEIQETAAIGFFINSGSVFNNFKFRIIFNEGSTDIPYEPYGYKIPVNVRSDNLFDINWYFDNCVTHNCSKELLENSIKISFTAGADAYIGEARNSSVGTTPAIQDIAIGVKNNTQYTFIASSLPRCYITYMDKNYDILNSSYIRFDSSYTKSSYTFTTPENCKYVAFRMGIQDNEYTEWTFGDIQLVEGSTVPSKYIPYYNETTNIYLDKPLRKIGDYSDYIDFINSKVVKNIGSKVYNGSENGWYISGKSAKIRLSDAGLINISNLYNYSESLGNVAFCNYFKQEIPQTLYTAGSLRVDIGFGIAVNPSTSSGLFFANNISSLNDFKEWLSANNVTVDYVLETPTEEDIELPNIPTIDGNNTLNIETEITPSEVYIKYKSNE